MSSTPAQVNPLRLLCLSDLHGDFERFSPNSLPDADAVLIAGDLTSNGLRYPPYEDEPNARGWFARMGARYEQVYYILGNHDLDMRPTHFEHADSASAIYSLEQKQSSLSEEGVFLLHGLRLTGINLSPAFNAPRIAARWANMTVSRKADAAAFDALPPVDILVSHCPPYGIGDNAGRLYSANGWERQHLGSPGLREYLFRVAPRLVVCGHIHEAAGVQYVETAAGETCVLNTALTASLVTVPQTGRVEVEMLPPDT